MSMGWQAKLICSKWHVFEDEDSSDEDSVGEDSSDEESEDEDEHKEADDGKPKRKTAEALELVRSVNTYCVFTTEASPA